MERIERFETIYKKICEDYQENHDRILFSDVVELHDIFREVITCPVKPCPLGRGYKGLEKIKM